MAINSATVAPNPVIRLVQHTDQGIASSKGSKSRSTSICSLQVRPTQDFLHHKQGHLTRPAFTAAAQASHPHLAHIYQIVNHSRKPNHEATKVPLTHGINTQQWDKLLINYKDKHLVEHLKFGFPLGFITNTKPNTTAKNHQSALKHPQAITKYIQTEITHGALAGPFEQPPFTPWFHTSPMMVRDKKDSADKRVIVDLSWPKGDSVNSNIPCDTYQGTPMNMTLPTPEDLATAITLAPPTAHIFSLDLS